MRVIALPPTVREQYFKFVLPATPIANVALPEPSVVTFPLITLLYSSVNDAVTSVLAVSPVIVKLRITLAGLRAKPLEYVVDIS